MCWVLHRDSTFWIVPKQWKIRIFFIREFLFFTNGSSLLALWLSRGGNVSQLLCPVYLCSCQGSRLGLKSCLYKISRHRWFWEYVFQVIGKYGFVPLTFSCECSDKQYNLVCQADAQMQMSTAREFSLYWVQQSQPKIINNQLAELQLQKTFVE